MASHWRKFNTVNRRRHYVQSGHIHIQQINALVNMKQAPPQSGLLQKTTEDHLEKQTDRISTNVMRESNATSALFHRSSVGFREGQQGQRSCITTRQKKHPRMTELQLANIISRRKPEVQKHFLIENFVLRSRVTQLD